MWQERVEQQFTKQPVSESSSLYVQNFEKYKEEKVDAMRLQKDKELEYYIKEIEREKRFK